MAGSHSAGAVVVVIKCSRQLVVAVNYCSCCVYCAQLFVVLTVVVAVVVVIDICSSLITEDKAINDNLICTHAGHMLTSHPLLGNDKSKAAEQMSATVDQHSLCRRPPGCQDWLA